MSPRIVTGRKEEPRVDKGFSGVWEAESSSSPNDLTSNFLGRIRLSIYGSRLQKPYTILFVGTQTLRGGGGV